MKIRFYSSIILALLMAFSVIAAGGADSGTPAAYKQLLDIPSEDFEIFPDQQGDFVLVSRGDTEAKVLKINGATGESNTLATVPNSPVYCFNNNSIYAFKPTKEDKIKTDLSITNLANAESRTFSLDGIFIEENRVAVVGDQLVYLNSKYTDCILQRKLVADSIGKEVITSVVLVAVDSIKSSLSGNSLLVHDSGEDRLLELTLNDYGPESGNTVLTSGPEVDYCSLSSTVIVDEDDTVFVLNDGTYSKLDIEIPSSIACVNAGLLFSRASDHRVDAFELNSARKTGGFTFEEDVVSLSSSGTRSIAIVKKDGQFFVAELRPELVGNDVQSEGATEPQTAVLPSGDKIQSNVYSIKEDSNTVIVPESTPVSKLIRNLLQDLRNSLHLSHAQLTKYDSILGSGLKVVNLEGKDITSGKVGTGAQIQLITADKIVQQWVVVVPGDVTGTGTVSNKDFSAICKHLFGDKQLEGPFLLAADFNQDGKVDATDLTVLGKKIYAA